MRILKKILRESWIFFGGVFLLEEKENKKEAKETMINGELRKMEKEMNLQVKHALQAFLPAEEEAR